MSEVKKFKQKTETIHGVDYTFQKVPIRKAMEIRQEWSDPTKPGGIDSIKMCDLVFANIVVSPKVKLDDFEDIEVAEDLALAAINFQYTSQGK